MEWIEQEFIAAFAAVVAIVVAVATAATQWARGLAGSAKAPQAAVKAGILSLIVNQHSPSEWCGGGDVRGAMQQLASNDTVGSGGCHGQAGAWKRLMHSFSIFLKRASHPMLMADYANTTVR